MNLSTLIRRLEALPEIRRKRLVGETLRALQGAWDPGSLLVGPGDDAAVLEAPGGGYLLLAADGILASLVERDPFRAGRAAVLVNVNDVYAMGGRPLALVNVLAGVTGERLAEVCRGIREECRRLGVPMAGGHVSPEGAGPFLAASVLGKAEALLLDRNAGPGLEILLAVDLRGERWGDWLVNLDSNAGKDPETLRRDLEVLCSLAEEGLCAAAKDVSNAGILGTVGMLLENAGLGGWVDLERIEVPGGFDPVEWLRVYPSYGFVLTCEAGSRRAVLERFRERGIWAAAIGRTDGSGRLVLRWKGEEATLFDLEDRGVLGVDPAAPKAG